MKIEGKVEMGKKGALALSGRCFRTGRAITVLQCGLAYAGNSIRKGDAAGVAMGLDTVGEKMAETESLMPTEKTLFRSIKAGVLGLVKELKPGRRISKKIATDMLVRVRDLGRKVDQLNSQAMKGCV